MFGHRGHGHRNGPRFAPGQSPAHPSPVPLSSVQALVHGRHLQAPEHTALIQTPNVKAVQPRDPGLPPELAIQGT